MKKRWNEEKVRKMVLHQWHHFLNLWIKVSNSEVLNFILFFQTPSYAVFMIYLNWSCMYIIVLACRTFFYYTIITVQIYFRVANNYCIEVASIEAQCHVFVHNSCTCTPVSSNIVLYLYMEYCFYMHVNDPCRWSRSVIIIDPCSYNIIILTLISGL